MSVDASRFGDDLLQSYPVGTEVPADLASGEIGANTLAAIRSDTGEVQQFSADGTAYNGLLVATREFEAAGTDAREREGDRAHRGLRKRQVIKLDTDSAISNPGDWLGEEVHATDEHTVSLSSGTNTEPVGPVREVREEEDMVYVLVE